MGETIDFIPSSFFLLLYNSGAVRSDLTHKQRFLRKMETGDQKNQFLDHQSRIL